MLLPSLFLQRASFLFPACFQSSLIAVVFWVCPLSHWAASQRHISWKAVTSLEALTRIPGRNVPGPDTHGLAPGRGGHRAAVGAAGKQQRGRQRFSRADGRRFQGELIGDGRALAPLRHG